MESTRETIHWVRVAGKVFETRTIGVYARGEHVLCRTQRGVEMGQILAVAQSVGRIPSSHPPHPIIQFLRRARPEDDLLWKHLQRLGQDAGIACQEFLAESGSNDVLLEVEPMFDGRTIYFHFLGNPTSETDDRIQQLTEVFQEQVASSRFASLVEHGCGPGCGTEEKSGCGTDGCHSCSSASMCERSSR